MVSDRATDHLGFTGATIAMATLGKEGDLFLLQCHQNIAVLLSKQYHRLTLQTDDRRFFKKRIKGQRLTDP